MNLTHTEVVPVGRGAICWFLFLTFYHILPVPWVMEVVGGLAPPSFLLAAGLANLSSIDNDSLGFALFLLPQALIA